MGARGSHQGKWLPGQAGNPLGRRPMSDLAYARKYTEEAIEILVSIMRHGETDAVRIDAAGELLSRGWGKPSVRVELQGHLESIVSGIDAPRRPLENAEQWLERRRKELEALTIEGQVVKEGDPTETPMSWPKGHAEKTN